MRKYFFVLFILFSTTLKAQISATTESPIPTVIGSFYGSGTAELTFIVKNGKTIYKRNFSDVTKTPAKTSSIEFMETGGALGSLYDLLKAFFLKENKKNELYRKTFKLGETDVACSIFQGVPTQIYFQSSVGSFYLSERHLRKLFGK
mgnify:FL=1